MSTDKKKSKRGPGRPKKPKGEGKIVRSFRFTEDEFTLFKKAAKRDNQTLSEWVRTILHSAV